MSEYVPVESKQTCPDCGAVSHRPHRGKSIARCAVCRSKHAGEVMEKYRNTPERMEKHRADSRRYFAEHGQDIRVYAEARLRYEYKIDYEDWARMYEKQWGMCPGCYTRLSFDRWTHVDYNHETGEVRGLLCHACNLTLGLAKEEIGTLARLIYYLEDHGAVEDDSFAEVNDPWREPDPCDMGPQ